MTLPFGKILLPSTVGFDRLLSTIDEFETMLSNNKPQTYPPYNIIRTTETQYEIQIAVSGFSKDNLEMELKDGKLTITGKQKTQSDTTDYLYRGIAARDFVHTFTLADTIVVKSADIVNGLLIVSLENIIPEEKKSRKITIGTSSSEELLTEA
jgi:molecular chaperone IbpA